MLNLPKIIDPRGNLTVAEQQHEVPFDVSRVYWTYDVPSGESRGGHAHKKCEEMIVAVSGSFDVTVDNGTMVQTFHLNHPYQALYVGAGIWRTLDDFSSGAVCLVLASDIFDAGITLTGGGAALYGLAEIVSAVLKVPCRVAEEPQDCVVMGCAKVLEEPNQFRFLLNS